MLQSPYWQRFWRRRLSRRRFLAASAVGLSAAALGGCGGGSGSDRPTPTALPAGAPGDAPPPASSRGGTLFLPGFEAFTSDTLDPHQTQFGPIYSSHSAVFSKILFYQDVREGVIAGDLAREVPESVDGHEYVIPLRSGVHFQRPSAALGRGPSAQERAVDGRELTADDVVFSFRRQMDPNSPRHPYYYRSYQYEAIERIEAVDPYTVRIVAKEPSALMLHYLADTNAFIVPREVIDQNDTMNSQEAMIGTGPFIWDELLPLNKSRFVRNPDWFGWDEPALGRPYIEAYESHFLADDTTLEATFREKKIDAALQVTNPAWVLKVRQEFPEVVGRDVGFSAWLNTRLLVDRPPFSDFRVRKAIHLAADRQ
ncbi:MAG TPA: ABC transporter substrate-binding protein, partial [Dehalococcoidia bacterium]|nr:ABC transporter substrate-binding protein [Dehalococcoidia bacterium]